MSDLECRVMRLEEQMAGISANVGNLRFVAGVLRCPTSGGNWIALNDITHKPLNIDRVYVDQNRVVITYKFIAKKVISLIVASDEYYTQMGVSCGASAGCASAAIYFNRRPDTGYCDPMTLKSNLANVWVLGVFEV